MELTPKTLAKLRQLADLVHQKNLADLSVAAHQRQALAAELRQARLRAGAVMPTDDGVVATGVWAASSDRLAAQLAGKISDQDRLLEQIRAVTRQSLAKTEACDAIEQRMQDAEDEKQTRIEDRAWRPTARKRNGLA